MSAMVRRLPLGAAYALADACGAIGFGLSTRLRRNTQRNFRIVLPEAGARERRTIARRSVQGYCRYLVDFARLQDLERGEIARQCKAGKAFERLRCEAAGRGAIVVPMHFGNWDAGAAAAVVEGFEVTAAADRFGDARLDDAVFGARERLGIRIVDASRASPAMVRTLRKGGLLALLIDRPSPGSGVTVPFFGQPTDVPAGPARLALRTGAAIVPAAFPRTRTDSPAVDVLADFCIDASGTGNREADVARITSDVMAAHERYIRRYPEQWYMFREMWPAAGDGR
jgi:KDO2-lipid IV(A) lauroyltransferase